MSLIDCTSPLDCNSHHIHNKKQNGLFFYSGMCLTNFSKLTTPSARFLHVTMKKPSLCDDCPNSMYSVPSSAVSLHLLCLPCTQKASSAGFSMTLMFDVLQADGLVSVYRPGFRSVFHAVSLCYEWTHCTAVGTLSGIQRSFKSC